MSSLCSLGLAPQWRHGSVSFFLLFKFKRRTLTFVPRVTSSSLNDDDDSVSAPKPKQLGYDLSEDLFGLEGNPKPRNASLGARKPRSWFGPNGQYIRELPCPSCRGRGYTPCTECGIERSRSDCSQCLGKGIMTCPQCLGDCVIWEESIDERPWEKARSISPLKVKEDDEVDNLEIKLNVKRKSKRVYQSPPPEVNLKISRSLKSLNAKTGLFSKRMKIIHRDPRLHAQRVAAIKKAKGTAAARKHTSETLKAFFSDPENRRKRSISMQGIKFYCRNCGREGHRRHYCPELKASLINRQFICGVCGEKGHNRRTCPTLNRPKTPVRRPHHCRICDQRGHNRTTCPKVIGLKSSIDVKKGFHSSGNRRTYQCKLCKENGHNSRTCPTHNKNVHSSNIGHQSEERNLDALDKEKSIIKECFLDLGSFPEDKNVPVNALIDIWSELYDIDEDTSCISSLYELSNRSLANLIDKRRTKLDGEGYYGEHYVTQHDLLRKLAIYHSKLDPVEHRERLIIDICGSNLPKWWREQKYQVIKARLVYISTGCPNFHLN